MNSLLYIFENATAHLNLSSILRLLKIAMVLIIVFFIAKIFILLSRQIEDASVQENLTISDPVNAPAPIVDPKILTSFDPFGAKPEAKPDVEIVTDAPETELNLKVAGMRADLSGESSGAIIKTPDGKQDIFYIGDEIIPGVTLKRVNIEYVILDRNGTSERLSLQGKTQADKKSAGTVDISLSELSYKASDLIDDLRFYPFHRDGNVIGYRVSSRRGVRLEDYGFKRNDVITAINGQSLTEKFVNMPALWKNFRLARYATIDIIRSDTPMTLQVNLK